MFRKTIILLGFVGLAGCTSVTAPLPQATSEWPFDNKDKVTFVLTEDALTKTVEELDDGKDNGDELLIEIKKNSPANEFIYVENNKVNKGNIWFKKSPDNKDMYAFAFSVPFPEGETAQTPEEIQLMNMAIYSRGTLEKKDGKTVFRTFVLECPAERLNKQTDCPYETEAEAWTAALTLPINGDGEKATIPFIVK